MKTIEVSIDGQKMKYNSMKNDVTIGDVVAVRFENLIRVSKIDSISETFFKDIDMVLGFLNFGNLEFTSAYQLFDTNIKKFSYMLRVDKYHKTLNNDFLDKYIYNLINRKTVFINNNKAFLLYIKYEGYYLYSSIVEIKNYRKRFSEYPRVSNPILHKTNKLNHESFIFTKTRPLRSTLKHDIKHVKNKLLNLEKPKYILRDPCRFNSYYNL